MKIDDFKFMPSLRISLMKEDKNNVAKLKRIGLLQADGKFNYEVLSQYVGIIINIKNIVKKGKPQFIKAKFRPCTLKDFTSKGYVPEENQSNSLLMRFCPETKPIKEFYMV